jgi:hypothetical protein
MKGKQVLLGDRGEAVYHVKRKTGCSHYGVAPRDFVTQQQCLVKTYALR